VHRSDPDIPTRMPMLVTAAESGVPQTGVPWIYTRLGNLRDTHILTLDADMLAKYLGIIRHGAFPVGVCGVTSEGGRT
jgi:hypothetical protein